MKRAAAKETVWPANPRRVRRPSNFGLHLHEAALVTRAASVFYGGVRTKYPRPSGGLRRMPYLPRVQGRTGRGAGPPILLAYMQAPGPWRTPLQSVHHPDIRTSELFPGVARVAAVADRLGSRPSHPHPALTVALYHTCCLPMSHSHSSSLPQRSAWHKGISSTYGQHALPALKQCPLRGNTAYA